ncbi:multicopper oxidase domain-containing protein [Phycicoccus mangrovi]|uniref:multicopper oxidase domain-containing protein n=1 Tax=Phycicoccus mangrovi TaxID=2840470 RepID=UPI0027E31326|nr:multicopper oxidase domain-containing protein [Phycicoccus mangrovi]
MSLPPAVRRARFPLRDRPGLVWLTLAVLVALAHPVVPAASWLVVHLVLLGAVTHSAMVWSTHFTQALLKTPDSLDDRRRQNRRILALLAGAALVLVGVPGSWWPLTVTGAALVSLSVVLHGLALRRRLRHALPGRFRITVRYYLVASSCLPVGAGFGAWLAHGLDDEQHGRVLVAHSMVMVLGWLGLTVTGTLVTLWPTMLRTRMDDRAERLARQALPVLVGAVALLAGAALAGRQSVALVGLAAYVAGLAWWGRALFAPARQSPPRTVATVSVAAAGAWGLVAVALVGVRLATSPSWSGVADGYDVVAAVVAVGFAGQLLTGALAHLIPVVLGGGPSVARAASRQFDRGWVARVVVVNVGLLVCLLPVPSPVRVAVSLVVLLALAIFVPLLLSAVRAAVAARRALLERVADDPPSVAAAPVVAAAGAGGQVVAGMALVALAVSLGVAAGPPSTGTERRPVVAVAATGHTTRVRVEAHDMAYVPSAITVPAGDRLVVDLVNVDPGSPHDLTFDDGSGTSRVMPGRSETLDVGVLGADTDGWCSIVGHRQMGMVLHVRVAGAPPSRADVPAVASSPGSMPVDLSRDVDPAFRAVDATIPPLGPSRVHRVTLHVRESVLDVAPGVRQRRWTFDGGVPGPTLHGRVGDTFVVTLVNEATMGHSIDFHAGEAVPAQVMRTIPPGDRLTYRFTADRAGLWMYHCSTMPMSTHIAAGMFGAVLIEPPDLPAVDHSYLLVQSEAHLDGDGRTAPAGVDAASASADTPDLVTFNGIADQYLARPLTARQGQRVRLWVLAAGPNRGNSFHVVGTQFDTVWSEGSFLLRHGRGAGGSTHGGAQTLALAVAQGGFAEITAGRPGVYPFVTHQMSDAERGARGAIAITP